MMIQQGILCTKCDDEVYSNSVHDLVSCKCEAVFIDGGFDYMRVGGTGFVPVSRTIDDRKLPNRFRDERGR